MFNITKTTSTKTMNKSDLSSYILVLQSTCSDFRKNQMFFFENKNPNVIDSYSYVFLFLKIHITKFVWVR